MGSIEKNALRYGIITAISLIAFFFIMRALGLIDQYELRALNIIFLFSGVYLSVRNYRKSKTATYLGGLGTGLFTSVIALAIFAAFIMIYLAGIDPAFMESLREYEYFGQYLNPYIAGAVIFLEGSISGLLVSFILMQFYKRSHLSNSEPAVP